MKEYPTQEYLNSILEYRNGGLYWKKCGKRIIQGSRAGSLHNKSGYRIFSINNSHYLEHRIIWIMFNNNIPDGLLIDHINMIKDDNRIENLRLVDKSLNAMNCNSKNIRILNRPKPYLGFIRYKGKAISKAFYTEQEASEWVAQKKSEIFQE